MLKNNTPPAEYKIKIVDRTNIQEDLESCRVPISVGGEKHEGNKFKATIEWAGKRFKNIEIHVGDTLQRHNIQFENKISAQQAYRIAKRSGDEWLERNLSTIELLNNVEGVTWKIIRWDDWLHRKDFPQYKKAIDKLMKTNDDFQQSIFEQMEVFWNRKKTTHPASSEVEFKKHSLKYLLEESAVFSIMFKETKAVDIYPGSFLLPFVRLSNSSNKNLPEAFGHCHFTSIDFNRIKSNTANTA